MSEIRNIPTLRFSDFTESWKKRKLKEFSTFFSGGTPTSTIKKFYNGSIPFIKSGEINSTKTKQFLSEEGLNNSSAKRVSKGDLLYALYGATSGEVGISKIDGAINQAVLCIRGDFNNNLLANYLRKEKNKIVSTYLQGGQGNLSADIIKNLKLFLPSLPEQQKIADFLTAVDKRIELLEKKKTLLETYKKGVMKKIFNQEIRFKDDNGNDFPDWEEKRLGDVFKSSKGKGLSKDKISDKGSYKSILYGELYTTYKEVANEIKSFTNFEEGTPSHVGDLLVPCSTTTTNIDLANVTAILEDNIRLGGDITILRSKGLKIDNIFYSYYLSNHKKFELAKFGQGTTIVHLYFSHFNKMRIDAPSFEEQKKISEFLSSIDNQIELLETQIDKSKTWKKGLLQKMFV